MLLLNLLTVGGVQVIVFVAQQQWWRRQTQAFLDAAFVSFLQRVYTAERLAATQVRALVADTRIREGYEDIIVSSGPPGFEGLVYLNPRGAVHRDPDAFPRREILLGMERARSTDGLIAAAGGFCFAVRNGDRVEGYLWFVPKGSPSPPRDLPVWTSLMAVAIGTVLFGAVMFWTVRRMIGQPLRLVGAAAARVGAGNYDVRLPALRSVDELDAVVASFNAMAAKVQSHTLELEHAVRQAVQAAEQRERALVVSARLASMGTLAAGIAHEINNPIGGMLNAVHRLLQSQDLGDKQRSYLLLIQDGLQRVARTARKVLDFSPRSVEASAFRLGAAVDGARALVDHRLTSGRVRLVVDLAPDLPSLWGDPHEIQQVVLNLLLNALDALEQRGGPGTIAVRAEWRDGRVHLHVDDDGPGIDPQDLGRVMDPFFSRKDRPDASGLGLFICYSIVRNHGGEISIDSAPGQGFHVHIALPPAPASG